MNKQNKFIIILLIGNLIISGFTIYYTKIKLNEIEDYNFQYQQTLINNIGDVYDKVETLNDDQKWLSDVDIKDGGIVDGKQNIELSWNLKDYTLGSKVTLFYRRSDEEDFKQIFLEPNANGSLMTNLEIETETQPDWHIYSEDKDDYSDDTYTYYYYISINDGNHILTSDTEIINLEKFNTYYYCPEIDVSLNKDNIPSDIEININGSSYSKIAPEKAFIELYNNGTTTEEELNLVKRSDDKYYLTDWENDDEIFDKLVIKIQYEDGKEFEKEIWNNNQ